MASGSSSREERRRKILDKGSDRLALIFTGRSQSFSSAPPSIDYISSPSLRTQRSTLGSYDDLASVSNGCDISTDALERKLKSIRVMLDLTKQEMVAAAAAAAASRDNTSMVEPSDIQKRSTDPASSPKPYRPRLLSSKRLHSCIIESENTRGFCAFIIAVVVVLSYVGYPLFGSHIVKTESLIAARPLYILLLTDLTIIMARLLLSAGEEDVEEERKVTREDNGNWDRAVKLLERGLVVYQSVRGIFIDYSVYMVVVVCGLSQI